MPKRKLQRTQEMEVQLNLEAHERECAVRYQAVQDKLESLEKRMWRIEGMSAITTLSILGLVISIVVQEKKMNEKIKVIKQLPKNTVRAGKPILRKGKKMGKRQGKN